MLKQGINVTPEMLEQILEMALAGYWIIKFPANGELTPDSDEFLSVAWKKMLGYADYELENKAKTWMSLMHEDDLPKALESLDKHVESSGSCPYKLEVRYNHKQGHVVYILCVGQIIEWHNDGKPKLMVGCHIDISDTKRLEMYEKSRGLLVQLNKQISLLKET